MNGRNTVAVYLVQGDVGVSQWRFTGTNADGSYIDVDGVDIFTLKDGKIQIKNAFRKARKALAPTVPRHQNEVKSVS